MLYKFTNDTGSLKCYIPEVSDILVIGCFIELHNVRVAVATKLVEEFHD